MTDKELYHQKRQAQLDEWKADLDKLKAKAARANAESQIEMHKHIRKLGTMLDDNSTMLSEFSKASGEAWDSIKIGVDTAWEALKCSFGDAQKKYKS